MRGRSNLLFRQANRRNLRFVMKEASTPVLATDVPVYPRFRVRYRVQMASIASAARMESFTSTSRETLVAAGLISMVAQP